MLNQASHSFWTSLGDSITIEYFFAYPITLIDGTTVDSEGLHPAIPFQDGLRLYPAPKPLSQCRSVRNYTPPTNVVVPADDSLTDPVALSPAFEAFAGLHSYRCYDLHPTLEPELCDSCRGGQAMEMPADRTATVPKPSPSSPKPKTKSNRDYGGGQGGDETNIIMRIWKKEHPEYEELQTTRVLVRRFTSRAAVERKLRAQGDDWVLENWAAERAALSRLRADSDALRN